MTAFGDKRGDCFAAVVASLLEIEIGDLPDLARPDQREVLNAWLNPRGMFWLDIRASSLSAAERGAFGWHEIGGMSPRGIPHSVVGRSGAVAHDPHPDRLGLLPDSGGIDDWRWTFGVLVPREPRPWFPLML
jgi:hypothetical protein